MANIKDNSIMLYSITFYREDEDTGEQIHYDYDGDCSWICDDIDESQLVEIKPKPDPEPEPDTKKCEICRKHPIKHKDYRFLDNCGLQGKVLVCEWCSGLNDTTISDIVRDELDPKEFYSEPYPEVDEPDPEPKPTELPLTNGDAIESLDFIWEKLHSYRGFDKDECGVQDEEWDDICTAMSWIEDECGVERVEGILQKKKENK